ncbi:hypothetical protein Pmani_017728 [Petrolisthes manimaculis]|uniref:Uncharacterized protein n=1 Tax=Petrolisthes manimaculis TaxID=1843537 RepID=A0AAE1U5I8_9EUCA|nr:hypothetical protein Pmani_017728 [Petrolisthes manimaculis]
MDLDNQDTGIDELIEKVNIAVTKSANDILGKQRPTKKPWVTEKILKLCDKRRELKQKKNTAKAQPEGARLYREANQQVRAGRKKVKKGASRQEFEILCNLDRIFNVTNMVGFNNNMEII